jgi:hypothetical protein
MIYVPWVIFTLGCVGLAWIGVRAKRKERSEEERHEQLSKVLRGATVRGVFEGNQAPAPTEGAAQGSYTAPQQQHWRN